MKTNGNNLAFVNYVTHDSEGNYVGGGLTKREHFAALAMQGLIDSSVGGALKAIDYEYFSVHAVKIADALIKALNEER